jgi:exosortase
METVVTAPHPKESGPDMIVEVENAAASFDVGVSGKTLPFSTRQRSILALLLFLATCAWFWQPFVELLSLTQQQEHYSHMLLIPWVSLYVFYLDRTAILTSREWSPWLGWLLLGAGALSYAGTDPIAWGPDHLSVTMLAFVVMCWGMFLFCFGISRFRQVSFGLLFLLFLVPLPSIVLEGIIGFLQRTSAEATALLFSITGIPVFREGFVFSLSNFTIHVAEECSGIRSTLSLVLTSLVAGHFFLRSQWGRMGIVALVIPLAIIKNAFRIVGLTLLANYVDPTYITNSALHRTGGIPLFLISLVLLFFLVWLVRRLEKKFGYESAGDGVGMGKPAAL